jgi:predicted TIM-barrel fold metal-dependent hydrolase
VKLFDSLVHVTQDGSWLGTTRYDASEARLLAELDKCSPARACLVGIPGWADDETVLRVWRQNPGLFVPIAGFDPTSPELGSVPDALAEIAGQGFAGVKLHPRLNEYDPLDERVLHTLTACGEQGLAAFIDTLFRQKRRRTPHPADIADTLATEAPDTHIVLLHGTGSSLLELFELGRMHPNVIVDLSFTILRYAGSSVDTDIAFMVEQLDQRVTVGSDFPEYVPQQAYDRFMQITEGISEDKRNNVLYGNLARLFERWEAGRR